MNAYKILQAHLYQIGDLAVKENPKIATRRKNKRGLYRINRHRPRSDATVLYRRLASVLRYRKTNDLNVVDRPPPVVAGVEHAERDDHFSSPRGIVQI